MSTDLFVVTGTLEDIERCLNSLKKAIMGPTCPEDIDWQQVCYLTEDIIDVAEILQNEAEEDL